MNPHTDLHQRFVQLGIQRKNLTRQLQALLPEIYKQEIFKKHNCITIYEYAWKFAGFSKSLVDKVMRTAKHLEDKPFLRKLIEKEGVHKVAMVATLATPETDKIFAKHVENMSKPALFEYMKEIRRNQKGIDENCQGLFEIGGSTAGGSIVASVPDCAPCCAVPQKIKIELDDEMQIIFLQLKKNMQKELKREFSNKEALKIMLKKLLENGETAVSEKSSKREKMADMSGKLVETKSIPGNGLTISANLKKLSRVRKTYVPGNGTNAKSTHQKESTPVEKSLATKGVPRHIKVHQKREMFEKQEQLRKTTEPAADGYIVSGETFLKCSYPGCNKPQMVIHHRDRFSTSQSHESIIPLCKEHHEFCHNGLIKNETGDPQDWKLNLQPEPNFADKLTLKYRKISALF